MPSWHSTTRRSATQPIASHGHGKAQQHQVCCTTRGNRPKERNGETNDMFSGQQACVPLRNSHTMAHTPLLQQHPIPAIHCIHRGTSTTRYDVLALRHHQHTSPRPNSLPLSLPPTDPGTPLTVYRGPGRQPYLRAK